MGAWMEISRCSMSDSGFGLRTIRALEHPPRPGISEPAATAFIQKRGI
jgi:hypothetical protein